MSSSSHEQFAERDVSEDIEMRNMLRSQNRKKKSGGFQSMGLSSLSFFAYFNVMCQVETVDTCSFLWNDKYRSVFV